MKKKFTTAAEHRLPHADDERQIHIKSLKNPRHERFAQMVAIGEPAARAYRNVYGHASNSDVLGPKLASKPLVAGRIAQIQNAVQEGDLAGALMTLLEKRKFLALIVRTPCGHIDENSPLAQLVEYETLRGVKGGRSLVKIKMPDKLRAIELDAKLAGEFTEKVEVKADGLAELLTAIRSGKNVEKC